MAVVVYYLIPTYPCIEQVLKKPFFISLYRKLTLAVTLDFVRSIKEPSLEAPSGQLKKLLKDLSSLKDAFTEEFVDELKIPYSSSNSGQKALPIWFPHCPTEIKCQMFKFIRSIKIYYKENYRVNWRVKWRFKYINII